MKIQQDDDDYKEVGNKEALPFSILLLSVFAVATAMFMIVSLIAIILVAIIGAMLVVGLLDAIF